MVGSALYGVLIGSAFVLFTGVLPQPGGSIALWAFLAVQMAGGATVCWRRTRLPFVTTAMAIGALAAAGLAVLAAAGFVFPNLPRGWWIPLGIVFAAGPALLLMESRLHRAEWRQWSRHMEHATVWDIVRLRHIPRLRPDRA
jgi:hypothetical protein